MHGEFCARILREAALITANSIYTTRYSLSKMSSCGGTVSRLVYIYFSALIKQADVQEKLAETILHAQRNLIV